MLKQAEREMRASEWRERLAGWEAVGGSWAAYARTHGWKADDGYRWRRVLRRGAARTDPVVHTSPRFARVAVRAEAMIEPRRATPVVLRLALANGRRAEVEIIDSGQLVAIVRALERMA